MNKKYEELLNTSEERKIEVLKRLFERDSSYLKKLIILFTMGDEAYPLLEKMTNNRIEEIRLFKEIYKVNGINSISLEEMKRLVDNRDFSKSMNYIMNDTNSDSNYAKACKEVLEILKHVSKEYYEKISKEFLQKLEIDADIEYEFKIDLNIPIAKIALLEETKDILALIKEKYWLDAENESFVEGIMENN